VDLVIRALEVNSKPCWKELHHMERHLSTVRIETLEDEGPPLGAVGPVGRGAVKDVGLGSRVEKLRPAKSTPAARAHTLVLTGELNHRSAHSLETEIERLCGEGVTRITIDLRQLGRIDAIGVAVIAFRCKLCLRQGFGFTLIPGPPPIHHAFERAGVAEMLPFQDDDIAARRLRAATPSQRLRDGCEQ
jgi:anti-anti-sigma factor